MRLGASLTSQSQIVVEYDLKVSMPDGTDLSADVFRPAGAGRCPVILVRTPYDKLSAPAQLASHGFDPLAAVRAGYAVVFQDCRGKFASEGRFRYFLDESEDGAATVAWAASMPWSDGSVAMTGPSYVAMTQLLAAVRTPLGLKAIVPTVAGSETYDGFLYQGGAFQLGFAFLWAVNMIYRDLVFRETRGEDVATERALAAALAADPWAALEHRPLCSAGPLAELAHCTPVVAGYQEWLEHPDRDAFWRSTAINEHYGSIDVPAIHIANWYDIFLRGSLENYVGLRERAASERARTNQRLVIGPSTHGPPNDAIGDIWLGSQAMALYGQAASLHLDFFDACLRGAEVPERPPVRLFVMGANRWRDESSWPLARARQSRYHLRADGGLTLEAPSDEPAAQFAYDPSNPVPTIGGATCLYRPFLAGARDRRANHGRTDVLVYSSSVLRKDLDRSRRVCTWRPQPGTPTSRSHYWTSMPTARRSGSPTVSCA
jgi:hypothetical protein